MEVIKLYTIGFTKISAEDFFKQLVNAKVKRVLDVRLNNVSQLAGFTKKDDLQFFLKAIAGIDYKHMQELAPTQALLDQYKKEKCSWENYANRFLDLIRGRKIEDTLEPSMLDQGCLLCSEATPHHCHRRLVAEYLKEKWGNVEIKHLTAK